MIQYEFGDLDFDQKSVFNELTNIVSFLKEHGRDITNLDEIWGNLLFLCDGGEDWDGLDFYEFKTRNLASDILEINRLYGYEGLEDQLSVIVHYLINQGGLFDRNGMKDINNKIIESGLYNSLMNEKELNGDYKTNLTSLIEKYSDYDSVKDLTNEIFIEEDGKVVSIKNHLDIIFKDFYKEEKSESGETKFYFRNTLIYFDGIRNGSEDISKVYKEFGKIIQEVNEDLSTVEGIFKNLIKFIVIESLRKTSLLEEIISKNNNGNYYYFNDQDYDSVFRFLTYAEGVKLSPKEVIEIKKDKLKELDLSEIKLRSILEDGINENLIDTSYDNFREQIKKNTNLESLFKIFFNKVENFDEYLKKSLSEFPEHKDLILSFASDNLIEDIYKEQGESEIFAKEIFKLKGESFFNRMSPIKMKILYQIDYREGIFSRIGERIDFKADFEVLNKNVPFKELETYLNYFGQVDQYKKRLNDIHLDVKIKDKIINVLVSNKSISNKELIEEYLKRILVGYHELTISYLNNEELINLFREIISEKEKVNGLNILTIFNLVSQKFGNNITIEDYISLLKLLSDNQQKIEHYFNVVSSIYSKIFSENNFYENKLLEIENEKSGFTKELENGISQFNKSISNYKSSNTILGKINRFFGNGKDETEIYKQIVESLEHLTKENNKKADILLDGLKEIHNMLITSNEFKENLKETNEELSNRFIEQIEKNEVMINLSKEKMELYLESYNNINTTIDGLKEKLKSLDIIMGMKLADEVENNLKERIESLKKNQ